MRQQLCYFSHMSDSPDILSHFTFLLVPRFSILTLACAVDALRAANLDRDDTVYHWSLVSAEGGNIVSSCGLPMPTAPIDSVGKTDRIAVCGGDNSHNYHSPRLLSWLRGQSRLQRMVGSLSDGAFVVAEAGLFNRYRSTIHWKCQDTYRARFPTLDVRASLVEVDQRRFSCAGGTASLDLMMHFIRQDMGKSAVERVAENFFHDVSRDDSKGQNLIHAFRYAHKSRILTEALTIMSKRLDQPLSIAQISAEVGTSHRSLDRAFRRFTGMSPARHFRSLRLSRAATLLTQTSLPISEIALNCGFSTASHLGRYFRPAYGCSPGQYRKQRDLETSMNSTS